MEILTVIKVCVAVLAAIEITDILIRICAPELSLIYVIAAHFVLTGTCFVMLVYAGSNAFGEGDRSVLKILSIYFLTKSYREYQEGKWIILLRAEQEKHKKEHKDD